MTIGTRLFVKFFCKEVGRDQFDNVYYQAKRIPNKRLVLYKGLPEASKIPALWNAWLHYTIDEVPINQVHCNNWEKTHVPNLTGTEYAYFPSGLRNKKRAKATGDYEAWTPSN